MTELKTKSLISYDDDEVIFVDILQNEDLRAELKRRLDRNGTTWPTFPVVWVDGDIGNLKLIHLVVPLCYSSTSCDQYNRNNGNLLYSIKSKQFGIHSCFLILIGRLGTERVISIGVLKHIVRLISHVVVGNTVGGLSVVKDLAETGRLLDVLRSIVARHDYLTERSFQEVMKEEEGGSA
jgi:glutaredoxin-related protein